jgi:F-type H+-transporting ATPase subunit gamma
MPSTQLIKRRIKSAQNISQITRAMQMVAASKMKKAQDQALNSKTYTRKLQEVLTSLLTGSTQLSHPLLQPNLNPGKAVLVVTSNKGLCGALNTNHFRVLNTWIKTQRLDQLQFVTIGKKGREFLARRGGNVVADFSEEIPDPFPFASTLPATHFLVDLFTQQTVGEIYVSYTDFVSTLSQRPKMIKLLPIQAEAIKQALGLLGDLTAAEELTFYGKEYFMEPSANQIINWLLPYFLELQIYHVLLESAASEHSARMVAMKNASENAKDLVGQLKLVYNKARQQQITAEISDIVTAWKSIQ